MSRFSQTKKPESALSETKWRRSTRLRSPELRTAFTRPSSTTRMRWGLNRMLTGRRSTRSCHKAIKTGTSTLASQGSPPAALSLRASLWTVRRSSRPSSQRHEPSARVSLNGDTAPKTSTFRPPKTVSLSVSFWGIDCVMFSYLTRRRPVMSCETSSALSMNEPSSFLTAVHPTSWQSTPIFWRPKTSR